MLSMSLLILWVTLPVITWALNLCLEKRMHPLQLYFFTMIAGYFLLLSTVWAVDAQLTAEMNSFDLDGDGGIGGAELTPEAERAMEEWASDTGRSFAPITGIPLTAIWYTILFAFLFCGQWCFHKIFLSNSDFQGQHVNSEIEDRSNDDGNPYRPPTVG